MMLRHSVIYLLSRGLPGIAGFFSVIVYTRILSPSEYGYYAYVLICVNLLNALLFQWLRLGLVRFYPKFEDNTEQKQTFLSTLFFGYILMFGLSILLLLFYFILARYNSETYTYMTLGLLYLGVTACFELFLTLFRSQLKPIKFGIQSVIKAGSGFLLATILILIGWNVKGLLIGLIIGTFISIIVFSRELSGVNLLKNNIALLKKLAKYGAPLTLTFGMTYILQTLDRVLLGLYVGSGDAGIYSVVSDFTQQTLALVMMVVNLSAFPIVVKKLEMEGETAARKQLRQNLMFLLAMSLPVTIGISMLSSNISQVLFGELYRNKATSILPIITFGIFFQGIKAYYTDLSFQLGRTSMMQIVPVILGIAMNVGMNVLLIPRIGVVGAAISSLISYAITLVMNWKISNRSFRLPLPGKDGLKIIVASCLMGVSLYPLSTRHGLANLIFQVIVGIFVYGGINIAFDTLFIRKQLSRKFSTLKLLIRKAW